MLTEWDGLKVDARCLDPRPPQMIPPSIYPEGVPFVDARPPQDRPDRLTDETYLRPAVGGINAPFGGTPNMPNGQTLPEGALSPLSLVESTELNYVLDDSANNPVEDSSDEDIAGTEESTVPYPPTVLEDDITFITGEVGSDADD